MKCMLLLNVTHSMEIVRIKHSIECGMQHRLTKAPRKHHHGHRRHHHHVDALALVCFLYTIAHAAAVCLFAFLAESFTNRISSIW